MRDSIAETATSLAALAGELEAVTTRFRVAAEPPAAAPADRLPPRVTAVPERLRRSGGKNAEDGYGRKRGGEG
jgi:hypothetical protein